MYTTIYHNQPPLYLQYEQQVVDLIGLVTIMSYVAIIDNYDKLSWTTVTKYHGRGLSVDLVASISYLESLVTDVHVIQ